MKEILQINQDKKLCVNLDGSTTFRTEKYVKLMASFQSYLQLLDGYELKVFLYLALNMDFENKFTSTIGEISSFLKIGKNKMTDIIKRLYQGGTANNGSIITGLHLIQFDRTRDCCGFRINWFAYRGKSEPKKEEFVQDSLLKGIPPLRDSDSLPGGNSHARAELDINNIYNKNNNNKEKIVDVVFLENKSSYKDKEPLAELTDLEKQIISDYINIKSTVIKINDPCAYAHKIKQQVIQDKSLLDGMQKAIEIFNAEQKDKEEKQKEQTKKKFDAEKADKEIERNNKINQEILQKLTKKQRQELEIQALQNLKQKHPVFANSNMVSYNKFIEFEILDIWKSRFEAEHREIQESLNISFVNA